jgi:hypothetical protein
MTSHDEVSYIYQPLDGGVIGGTYGTEDLQCTVLESGRGESSAGYDNIGLAMLTVFQCTTLAGWSQAGP